MSNLGCHPGKAGGHPCLVSELIERLREFGQDSEVFVQYESRRFARPVWIGIMDTAGLFDEEKDFQLVISTWELDGYLKLDSDEQRTRRK